MPEARNRHPRLRSIPVGGRIEKELDAVEVFFLEHVVAAELLRALGAGALNCTLLHVVGNVQIAPPVVVGAILVLQIRHQLAQRLALFGHHVGQQQAVQHAVALGQESANSRCRPTPRRRSESRAPSSGRRRT